VPLVDVIPARVHVRPSASDGWRIEWVEDAVEAVVSMAEFYGPSAERLAREYLRFKFGVASALSDARPLPADREAPCQPQP
jgi:hypothetical protein